MVANLIQRLRGSNLLIVGVVGLIALALAVALVLVLGPAFRSFGTAGGTDLLTATRRHLDQQDFAAALIDSRNLLQGQPNSAAARALFAQALLGSGDLAGAQTELERARTLGLPRPELMPTQAALLIAQGKAREVVAQFSDTSVPDDAAAAALHLQVARAHVELADNAAALISVERALVRMPKLGAAILLQARLHAAAGQVDVAQRVADGMIDKDSGDAQGWLLRGDVLAIGRKDPARALPALHKAVQLGPRRVDAHVSLVSVLLRQDDFKGAAAAADAMHTALPGNVQALYYQALTAYLKNDFALARERLQRLQVDANPRLLLLAGVVEARLGQLAQAETMLARVVQMMPDEPKARRELGAVYLQRGQPERALATIQRTLAAGTNDAETWRLAGQAHARIGDFVRADQAFKRVKLIRPDDSALGIDTGRLLMVRGDFEAGLRELEAASKADVQGIAADIELVAAHMGRKELAAALARVDAMVRKQPDAALPLLIRGRVLAAAGKPDAARQAFAGALAMDPGSFAVVQSLAEQDLSDNKPEAAQKLYEKLLDRDPRSVAAMLALAELTLRQGGSRTQVAEWLEKAVKVNPLDLQTWRSAIELQRDSGDGAGALARTNAALAALPDQPDLLSLLAESQLAEGDALQALSSISRLVELRPDAAEVHLRQSDAYLKTGQLDRALVTAEKALRLAPDWVPAARGVIRAAVAAQQAPRALAIARVWQSRRPAAPLGWQLEGEIALTQGRPDAAAAVLRTAMDKGPSSDLAWLLFNALARAGRMADARQHAETWLRGHPDDATFLDRLGEDALQRGELAESEARYREALRLQPASALHLNNLAYLLVQRRNPEALDLSIRAARAAPYSPAILDTLAAAFAASDKLGKAAEVQARVVELAPKAANYRLQLARYLLQNGDKAKAREQLERVQRQQGAAQPSNELLKLMQQAQS